MIFSAEQMMLLVLPLQCMIHTRQSMTMSISMLSYNSRVGVCAKGMSMSAGASVTGSKGHDNTPAGTESPPAQWPWVNQPVDSVPRNRRNGP